MIPEGPCIKGLVTSYKEVVDLQDMEPRGKSLGHWRVSLKGIVGPQSLLPPLFCYLAMVCSFATPWAPVMMAASLLVQRQWNQLTMAWNLQNKPFIFLS